MMNIKKKKLYILIIIIKIIFFFFNSPKLLISTEGNPSPYFRYLMHLLSLNWPKK